MIKAIRNSTILLLFLLVAFHIINNVIWYSNDGQIFPGCHSVWHEQLSVDCSQTLTDPAIGLGKRIALVIDFFKLSHFQNRFAIPNFSITNVFLMVPHALPLSGHMRFILLYIIFFIPFLGIIFLLYWLGTLVFNRSVGLWAASICAFYPGIIGLSRKSNTVLLTTIIVMILCVVLLQWKKIKPLPLSLLCAAVVCLGILESPLFFAYCIPLVAVHFVYVLCVGPNRIKRFLSFFVFVFCISAFFYWFTDGNVHELSESITADLTEAYDKFTFRSDSFIGSAKEGIVGSFLFANQEDVCPCTQTINVGANLKTFSFYPLQGIKYLSPPFFILGLLSLIPFFRSKKLSRYQKTIFATWLIGGYLLCTVFHIKWGKFIVPLLPLIALSSGYFINTISGVWSRIIKIGIVLVGVVIVLFYSFVSIPKLFYSEKLVEGLMAHKPMPSRYERVARNVARDIHANTKKAEPLALVFLDGDSLRFYGDWIADFSLRIGLLIRTHLQQRNNMSYYWESNAEFYDELGRSDFILVITHKPVRGMKDYLFVEEDEVVVRQIKTIKFYSLAKNTYIYLVKIHHNDEPQK